MRRPASSWRSRWLLLAVRRCAAAAPSDADAQSAKTLFFDRKYAEARQAWQARPRRPRAPRRRRRPTGSRAAARTWASASAPSRSTASSWLARPPTVLWPRKRAPAASGWRRACTRRAQTQHLTILKEALADPSRTVRYYAAFQLAGARARRGPAAVPCCWSIVAEEEDPDLVERAKLGLLRLDPRPARTKRRGAFGAAWRQSASWLKVRDLREGAARARGLGQRARGAGRDRLQEPARRREAASSAARATTPRTSGSG